MKKLAVGDTYSTEFSISKEDIDLFTTMSGDTNNIHFDIEAAVRSAIGAIAVPGILSASKVSGVHGTQFPGHGTVYASEYLKWRRPIFVGVVYTVEVRVTRIKPIRQRAKLHTIVRRKDTNQIALITFAEVVHKQLI